MGLAYNFWKGYAPKKGLQNWFGNHLGTLIITRPFLEVLDPHVPTLKPRTCGLGFAPLAANRRTSSQPDLKGDGVP